MKNISFAAASALAAFVTVVPAQSMVVVGPTIGGLATFTDTVSGNHWLKLNDFFGVSGTGMIAAATTAGFTVATRADITALTNTLPLDGTFATWNSYASVMGQAPSRNLLWGAYIPDPAGSLGWAFSFDTDTSWQFVDNAYPAGSVANGGTLYADENLWAFTTGNAVPEPASWALMIAGFGMMGTALRRRRTLAAA